MGELENLDVEANTIAYELLQQYDPTKFKRLRAINDRREELLRLIPQEHIVEARPIA